MLASEILEGLDNVFVPPLAEQKLCGFMETNDQHPGNAQDKDKGSRGVEEISPSHVVSIYARD
jgi:hypothetical protein